MTFFSALVCAKAGVVLKGNPYECEQQTAYCPYVGPRVGGGCSIKNAFVNVCAKFKVRVAQGKGSKIGFSNGIRPVK